MRRVVCILIALVVLAPTLAMAQAFRCKADGRMRAACCCPHEEPNDAPSISRTCCCDLVQAVAPAASDRSSVTASVHVPVHAPVAITVATPVERVAIVRAHLPAAPPPPDPLFLTHCSFLL